MQRLRNFAYNQTFSTKEPWGEGGMAVRQAHLCKIQIWQLRQADTAMHAHAGTVAAWLG